MRQTGLIMALFMLANLGSIGFAQQRAEMSEPLVAREGENVVLRVSLQKLAPGGQYRIGVGAAQEVPSGDMELLAGKQNSGAIASNFTQGFTAHWWNVDKLQAQGFIIESDQFAGNSLTFRAVIGKEHLDKLGQVFVFIARKYGENTWYLEDGVELNQSHW